VHEERRFPVPLLLEVRSPGSEQLKHALAVWRGR
jgi:hypothetical protein